MRISDWSSDVCSSDLAEGAAVVAALLHLDEGARAFGEAGDELRRGLLHRHDVVHGDARRLRIKKTLRAQLLLVAEHAVDLGHGGEALRVDLGRAAGDDDLRVGVLAPRLADRLARLAPGHAGDRRSATRRRGEDGARQGTSGWVQ